MSSSDCSDSLAHLHSAFFEWYPPRPPSQNVDTPHCCNLLRIHEFTAQKTYSLLMLAEPVVRVKNLCKVGFFFKTKKWKN